VTQQAADNASLGGERPEAGRRPSDKGGLVARLCLFSRLAETICC